MEPTGDNWRNKLDDYLHSVQNLTEAAIKSIKRDRIRNNLPFDDEFKTSIVERARLRYMNLSKYFFKSNKCILVAQQFISDNFLFNFLLSIQN